ncbi:RNA polymerase sigma factor RpoD/SigA [Vulcanococcus limneticus]|uniref:sigma-70 family RNA polymerase sigma factor n=1 Tax=Vulcanococcus limneticus TaxID=2170428 RepID=UPI00398C1F5C
MTSVINSKSKLADGLSDYLRMVGRIPLLTPPEELHLGGIVQEWLSQSNASTALRRSGARARNRMVSANLPLVVMICRRYQNRIGNLQLEMLDLLQAGNLGLVTAVEKFDPSKGYKFSTYAFWWIRHGVRHCIHELGNGIRIPKPLLSLAHRAESLQACAAGTLSDQAMAESLGEEPQRIEKALRIVGQCRLVSLDKPVGALDDGACLLDVIQDEHTLSPEEDYRWLHRQVQTLDAREQQLLNLRYIRQEACSFSQVAQIMGVSKNYTQSLERRTLRKLRQRLNPVLVPVQSA